MGSFVLDFAAYNALLSSNSHGGTFFGADDAFVVGEHGAAGRRNPHLHHHSQQQQQQPQQGSQQTHHHHSSHRFHILDRNPLVRLEAEKTLQDRRKQHIANFGATWLKPPGVAKTLFQIREECREQEEQAEAERREELAQQLAQAEAAAAMDGDDTGAGDATGADGTDLAMDADGMEGGAPGEDAMGVDMDMDEQDLDNEIPDGDGEGFSFGDNNDDDDPFASSSDADEEDDDGDDDDDDDGDEEEEGDRTNSSFGQPQRHHHHVQQQRQQYHQQQYQTPVHDPFNHPPSRRYASGGERAVEFTTPVATRTPGQAQPIGHPSYVHPPYHQRHQQQHQTPTPTLGTPIDDQREQERREMRQMRATEDRMRAILAHPRLSGGMAMGLYGDDDEDLDEEDQAQMLQEDDLVHASGGGRHRHGQATAGGRHRSSRMHAHHHHQHHDGMIRSSLGPAMISMDDGVDLDADLNADEYTDEAGGYSDDGDASSQLGIDNRQRHHHHHHRHHGHSGMDEEEMDMDADLDNSIPDASAAMDLSMIEDGGYEHTDSEAELSSSMIGGATGSGGGGRGLRDDDDGVSHSFLVASNLSGGASGMSMSSSSAQRFRSSLAGRSDRNSLDISSLLSRDGSSNMGSSPRVRRL